MANEINYSENYDVFLSYRRDGGETMAILLRDRLVAKGYNVFLDIESLNSGSFNKKLLSVIENCTDIVVVCTKNSLDRCKNEGDWVRMEIAHALKSGKNVVPIFLRDFNWPPVLPADINEIRTQNGVEANSTVYFDAAIDRLASKFLQSMPHGSTTKKPKTPKQPIAKQPLASKNKGILIAALSLVLVVGLVFGGIALWGKKAGTNSVQNSNSNLNKTPNNPNDMLTYDAGVIINGVKWATRNVDKPGTFAATPEDAGMFYQWNRRIGWSATDPMINSNGGSTWDNSMPTGDTWEKANDPSPSGWRVPTLDEIEKLIDTDKVSNEETTLNGVNGCKFTDINTGNSLFLPAVGYRVKDDGLLNVRNCSDEFPRGDYWSTNGLYRYYAYYLRFCSTPYKGWSDERSYGLSLRAVAE